MDTHAAVLGVNWWYVGDGLFVAGPLEGIGDFDAGDPDHLLLPLHLFLYPLWPQDTQEVLPVHPLLIYDQL